MALATADLWDEHGDELEVVAPILRDFGGKPAFAGPISTVKCHEDNVLVRRALEEDGAGRVLVVDGGGSRRCALLGDRLAALARDHGWAGVVIWGCLRDSREVGETAVGVKALGTNPRKSVKKGEGERDVPVTFGGVTFRPGHWLYADEDGILVAPRRLGG